MVDDIGAPAINRPAYMVSDYTIISKENPADFNGYLDKVAIYGALRVYDVQVATFRSVGDNLFTTRATVFLGDLPQGYSEHDINLEVKAGDYIGAFWTNGRIDRTNLGEGYWYNHSDKIPCTAQLFTFQSSRTLSLYAWRTVVPTIYLNWLMTDIAITNFCTGLSIVLNTDVPCHLWLRNTIEPPGRHIYPVMVRGAEVGKDVRFCFVSYDDLEQDEPGDTLEHTFTWSGLQWCLPYYFYFWGTSQGESMVSTSPIFHSSFPAGDPPFETCERQKLQNGHGGFCQYWNARCQTFLPDHRYTIERISLILTQWSVLRRGPFVVKITKPNGACHEEVVIDSQVGYSTDLPLPGVYDWTHFNDFHQFVFKDQLYRIVVHTLPGWEEFVDGEWVPWEAGAALSWRIQTLSNPYPRGKSGYGCNFKDSSGSWTMSNVHDHAFIVWQKCPI